MKFCFYIIFTILGALVTNCSSSPQQSDFIQTSEKIKGRNSDASFIYRIKVPIDWIRRDPLPTENLIDTKKALCEFLIRDESGEIVRIAIHNFPTESIEERIPPSAQINRWQQQLDHLNFNSMIIKPISFSGFSGLFFEGSGITDQKETTILAWSLQIAPEHYRALSQFTSDAQEKHHKQMRSDVTIKAVGSKNVVEKYKEMIERFAQTFELVEEIPRRS